MKKLLILIAFVALSVSAQSQSFDGLNTNLGNLYRTSNALSRSISPENYTGAKGKGGMADPSVKKQRNINNSAGAASELGQGWKVNPNIVLNPLEIFTLAEIEGPGIIQHIWITTREFNWRSTILRIYWDDESEPSVECPLGDFFGMGWEQYAHLNSLAVCVNPGSSLNSYWQMPFRKKCKITVENINEKDLIRLYYQIDYALTSIPEDAAYFHAQWRRSNPNMTSIHTILDGVKGKGQYVGLYLAWQVNNNRWWGEGEVKFYIDDKEFPTICGTGTEDYFCGSYNFDRDGQYTEYSTPYAGLHQIIRPDGTYNANQRFGMYRWHILDPIRFEKNLKVTIQDLGWRYDKKYLLQKSDIASTVFWYQTEPHAPFPKLPSRPQLGIN